MEACRFLVYAQKGNGDEAGSRYLLCIVASLIMDRINDILCQKGDGIHVCTQRH